MDRCWFGLPHTEFMLVHSRWSALLRAPFSLLLPGADCSRRAPPPRAMRAQSGRSPPWARPARGSFPRSRSPSR